MSSKDFVSLSFLGNKIQIIYLNSAKNKVDKFYSANIPPQVIANNKVQNLPILAGIIKKIWKDLRLKNRTVGIVIPEFSTFTKLLTLPKLDNQDLNEAIQWQIQDFLPSKNSNDVVFDWKIVNEDNENYQILVVVIQKDILAGYVEAVGSAGLYPLVVETPSLSLARIAKSGTDGQLIIYNNNSEVVLVIAQGDKIFGSSVVLSNDSGSIIKTAVNIINHFNNVEVKKIRIAGLEWSRDLLNLLQNSLNRPVEWVSGNYQGVTVGQIQEYLIPISLQLVEPVGPESEKTVNLLSPEWVKTYADKKSQLEIWSLLIIASIIIWSCTFLTVGFYLFLLQQENALVKFTKNRQAEIPDSITQEIDKTNKLIEKITKIGQISILPQKVINQITKAKPGGISLSNYQLDLDTGKIILKGVASNRQSLIDFKKELEKNKDFSAISIPISSYEVETDLKVEISFDYLPIKPAKVIKLQIK